MIVVTVDLYEEYKKILAYGVGRGNENITTDELLQELKDLLRNVYGQGQVDQYVSHNAKD